MWGRRCCKFFRTEESADLFPIELWPGGQPSPHLRRRLRTGTARLRLGTASAGPTHYSISVGAIRRIVLVCMSPAKGPRAHLPIVGGVWRALCWPAEWHGHLARGRAQGTWARRPCHLRHRQSGDAPRARRFPRNRLPGVGRLDTTLERKIHFADGHHPKRRAGRRRGASPDCR